MKRDIESELKELKSSLASLSMFSKIAEMEEGKKFIQYLSDAEDEVLKTWNHFLLNKIPDENKTTDTMLFNLASFRSKLQTLRALRKRFAEAPTQRLEIEKQIAQLEMQNGK